MTADATHDAAERYSRVGATGYLTKPLDFDDVLEALDSVLQPAMKG
jgi:DNA-binding NarL/FixJ family response regulator